MQFLFRKTTTPKLYIQKNKMRVLLQRVREASVQIDNSCVAAIDKGILLFVAFSWEDSLELPKSQVWKKILTKIPEIRIFPDQEGKSNYSLFQIQGDVLIVSQFTLYADCRKGRRPSYNKASTANIAEELYNKFISELDHICPGKVKSGIFGAEMDISLCNWGPLTILLDSSELV